MHSLSIISHTQYELLGNLGLCTSVGAVLTKANLTKALFPNPTQYRTARYPRILLTSEEMQEVKAVQPKGTDYNLCTHHNCNSETPGPQQGCHWGGGEAGLSRVLGQCRWGPGWVQDESDRL